MEPPLRSITVPLVLDSQTIIAVSNFRRRPDGIRLWVSRDGGAGWLTEPPIQLWDADQKRIVGKEVDELQAGDKDEGVWQKLATYTFGTPDLVALADGSILLSYYAITTGVEHIRSCRFTIVGKT